MSEGFWIGLQADYDIAVEKSEHSASLADVEFLGA
jgi:plasmid maintenance system antidote protein VapI